MPKLTETVQSAFFSLSAFRDLDALPKLFSQGGFGKLVMLKEAEKEEEAKETKSEEPHFLGTLQQGSVKLFQIFGYNGEKLVEQNMVKHGWKRSCDRDDLSFTLRWTECLSQIDYENFKEGEQLVNHIPNARVLTNKLELLNSLQEYERVTMAISGGRAHPRVMKMSDFVPETFRLDERHDRTQFLQTFKDGEVWICKPAGLNQGRGIFLVRNVAQFTKEMEMERDSKAVGRFKMSRIIQRYIKNPLLLEGRKFDIRAYMLVASTVPYLVLYGKGYVRLAIDQYSTNNTELASHLTNQYMQKKHPLYHDIKEDTVWSMERLNDYINTHFQSSRKLEANWCKTHLTRQMQRIMLHCFHSIKYKLACKIGFFDLLGFDFLIDDTFHVWLIEINVNPALACNCEGLKEVIPGVVEESINISLECFEKSRKNKLPLCPLQSRKDMVVLYSEDAGRTSPVTRPAGRIFNMPKRLTRSRSLSPVKMSVLQPTLNNGFAPVSSNQSSSSSTSSSSSSSVTGIGRHRGTSETRLKTDPHHSAVTSSHLTGIGGVGFSASSSSSSSAATAAAATAERETVLGFPTVRKLGRGAAIKTMKSREKYAS